MELKWIKEWWISVTVFLLIAPLMELKWILRIIFNGHCNTFNRTAYGIEIRNDYRPGYKENTFNRTAYGIEMI